MKTSSIINSFVAGELSPRLAGRTDVLQYFQSAAEIRNMLVEFYGGAKKAPGTRFIAEVKTSSLATRIKRFVFSDTQAYILEFGNQYIRFYKNDATTGLGGPVLETEKVISNVVVATGVITATSHGYSNGDKIYISEVVGTTELNGRSFLVANVSTHTFTLTDMDGVAIDTTGYTAYSSDGIAEKVYTLTSGVDYLTADLFELQFAQKEDVLYITHPDYPQLELTRTAHTSWTATDIDYSTGAARPALMPENITATTITPSAATGDGITLEASVAIFDITHEGSIWKINTGYVKITDVASGGLKTAATANVLYSGTLTGTSAYTNWSEGAWSGYRGYPKSVTLYENRLIYGYTKTQPQTTWESAIGAYKTFELGLDDADPMSWKADTNEVEVINWLYPSDEVLIGTVSGLHTLGTGSNTTALTPTTTRIKKKSKDGTSAIIPQQIGNIVYYWQKYNRILREYLYSLEVDNFQTNDATAFSEHISESGIVDMDYQQSPIGVLWCVRADGKLAVFTRQIEQKVSAWSLHDTQGYYESVAVIPKTSYDEVWFVVKRTIGGVTRRYIEVMTAPDFSDIEDAFFLHSGLTLDDPKTITNITQANPVVVTAVNDFTDGDIVKIKGLVARESGAISEKTVDSMEYATDGLAQAAYVTNGSGSGYGSNIITGGIASADSSQAGYEANKACDGNTGTRWASQGTAYPHWWKYDLGAGVTKTATKLRIYTALWVTDHTNLKDFTLQGSNNDSDWTVVYTGQGADTTDGWQEFTFANSTAYRYYKINCTSNWKADTFSTFFEVEMMETVLSLQSYSESIIKTQGSYSLKINAAATESLNKTLTRTISPTLNLTDVDEITFDIRCSRTGSNIKIGFHDSGGTTTEYTPNIASAGEFQTFTIDISGVTNANKDAIDSIIITILNADAGNTVYIDNMFTVAKAAETVGMAELNNNSYIVDSASGTSFALKDLDGVDVDGTDYTAYDTGGEARKTVNTVSGLWHLATENVQVFADGAYHADRTVSAEGVISLDGYHALVSVGLGYTARLKTNDLEASPGGSTSQGKTKRVSEIKANLYNSLDFTAGTDAKMDNVSVRDVALASTERTPLFTGIKKIPFPSGWDTKKQIVIEQEKCLPLHILSIVSEMESN